jgi:uncharacterized protein YfaS (alpha-2-macroglobulin family)
MTAGPNDPQEPNSSSDPNSSASKSDGTPSSSPDAAAKAQVKSVWDRFRPALYLLGFLFACFCAVAIFAVSPALRAAIGPYFYSMRDPLSSVQQASMTIPSGKRLSILLNGVGSTSYHARIYKYDKNFSPSAAAQHDPEHVYPYPHLQTSEIINNQVNGTVVWETDKTLRYVDFDRYIDKLEFPDNLPPGDYFYTLTFNGTPEKVEERTAAGAFRVSDISFLLKTAPDKILVRAYNVKTMQPIPDASVQICSREGGSIVPGKSIKTQSDGTAIISEVQKNRTENPSPVLLVKFGDNKASVSDEYPSGWRTNLLNHFASYGISMMNDVLDIITDKPIYRLGQTVMYKGFLRRLKVSGGYEAPVAGESIPIEIRDPEGNTFLSSTTKTGEFGDFTGSFTIPADGKTGSYTINPINFPNSAFGIEILQYRKPEYEVAIQPEAPFVLAGKKAKAKVVAKYFFGGPVAGAKVDYTITRAISWKVRDRVFGASPEQAFFGISAADRYNRSMPQLNSYSADDAPVTGSGLTNDKGEFEVAFDTKLLSKESPWSDGNQAQEYNIQATITDLSRKSVDTTGDALATPGNYALALQTDSWLAKPGEKLQARIEAKDYYGKTVPSRNIALSLEQWTYDTQKKKWETSVIASANTSTDQNGKASSDIQVPADYKGHELLLCARSKDADGNDIMDYSSLWVENQNSQNADFKLELDKLVYEPNDTVKAVLKLPQEIKKKKLIGIASIDGTTIFAHKCLDANSANAVIEFPLKDSYAPQSTLRVLLVDEEFNQITQESPLKIYPRKSLLDVSIKPNKEKLEPGETAEFSLTAKTFDGKPAANTPVVLSLVDESIYAISPDSRQNIVEFFQSTRPSYVNCFVACQPIPSQQLPGVAWFINPFGGFESQARSFGTLAEKGMMMEGASDSMSALPPPSAAPAPPPPTEQRSMAKQESDGASSAAKEPVIRADFKDTAFFSGAILTDSKGEAKVKTKLPDNLTTWRASASLLNKDSAAGYVRKSILTTKPMVARISLPRFFTQDDRGVVTAIVHNFSNQEQNVNLELRLGDQFKASLPTTQSIKVAPQGAGRFTWPIDVVGDGKTKITLLARGASGGDALVQDLNILSHTFPAFAYHNGILKETNGKLELPLKQFGDARGGTGKFTLKVSPSAIGPVLGNFDQLIDYPYGCTEQTMSRMMPSVVAMQLHNKLGLPLSDDMQDLFKRVYHASLAKLVAHHNGDGGWGWWQGDTSNLYLTAYVMEGLHWLKASGFTYDQDMNQRGNQWLQERLNQFSVLPPSPDEMTDLCYAFYALSLDGQNANVFARLKAPVAQASSGPEALSYLTLAYKNLGMEDEARKSYAVLKELANKSWEYVNWEHTPELFQRMGYKYAFDYSYRFTPAETTALAFRAALVMEPTNEKYLASIRNWILVQHDENGWTNTKTTSQVFLALLSDEMKMGGKRPCNFEARATVSGKTLASYLFNQSNRYSTEKVLKLQLLGNEDKITITKTGPGNLHYSSTLEYLRRIEKGKKVVPRSSPPDLTVERHFYKLERYKVPKTEVWATRGVPIDESGIKTGDLILMKVKIHAPFSMPYIKVEAPLPSGAEVISKQESIETQDMTPDGLENSNDASLFNYWWTHQDILDDRIVFFVTQMAPGNAEFQSLLRMEMPGELNANPVSFEGMYSKAIRGYSEGDTIKVTETPSAE